eukprot:tig00021070_g17812.t1
MPDARFAVADARFAVLVLARKLLLVLINVYGAASAPAPAQGSPGQINLCLRPGPRPGSLLLTVAFGPFPTRRLNAAISIAFLANAIILFASTVFVSGGLEGYVQDVMTWFTLFSFVAAVLVLLLVCLSAFVDR